MLKEGGLRTSGIFLILFLLALCVPAPIVADDVGAKEKKDANAVQEKQKSDVNKVKQKQKRDAKAIHKEQKHDVKAATTK